jgi:hypothetical protein
MDDLLPHYERELAFLRTRAGDFAKQYPKIAGRLQLSGDVGDDPHVERLIEAFAFLSARIKRCWRSCTRTTSGRSRLVPSPGSIWEHRRRK